MSKELTISNLDQHLKPLQIDGVTAPIELSTEAIRMNKNISIQQDLSVTGDIYCTGTYSGLNLDHGMEIYASAEISGGINLKAQYVSIQGTNWEGDGDTSDNVAALALFPSSGYDAKILLYEAAGIKWAIGNDADDSDKFKVDVGTPTIGGATKLTLDSSGNLTVTGDVTAGDDVILPSTGRISFDGGSVTHIAEHSTHLLRFTVGGAVMLDLNQEADIIDINVDNIRVADGLGTYAADGDSSLQTKAQIDAGQNIQIAEVTVNESEMNALNSTEKTIIAAQGAGKVIVPTSGMLFIDHPAGTPQGNSACDLFISWNGGTASNNTIYYMRRFMYGESGDRIWHLQHFTGEAGQSLTAGDNQPLTVKLDSAVTTDSITSMKIVISYHIYDNG